MNTLPWFKPIIFFMADKFGAAMALVKSDIGGNIAVCLYHMFLWFVLIMIISLCIYVSMYVVIFKLTCYGYTIHWGVSLRCGWYDFMGNTMHRCFWNLQLFVQLFLYILRIIILSTNATCSNSIPYCYTLQRLESKYNSNPDRFNCLYSLVQGEIETKTEKSSSSCANGLLWLTRWRSRGYQN